MYFPFRIETQVPFFILVFQQNLKIEMLSLEVYDIYLYSFHWFYFFFNFIRSPESLRWPIAMGWRPSSCVVRRSSCVVRRASCVNIFFSRTTGPILSKFDM